MNKRDNQTKLLLLVILIVLVLVFINLKNGKYENFTTTAPSVTTTQSVTTNASVTTDPQTTSASTNKRHSRFIQLNSILKNQNGLSEGDGNFLEFTNNNQANQNMILSQIQNDLINILNT